MYQTHLAPKSQRPTVVVDVETTGFGWADRIIEIAMVAMDPDSWETVDEYDTLLNPERDVGATGVHGINASMVEAAPVFGEVAADLARRLNGAVLVAHNLPFDSRMLCQEFRRNDVKVDMGAGLCTLRTTRAKLPTACAERGIPLPCAHRALADARATAELARRLWGEGADLGARPVSVGYVAQKPGQHTLRRGLVDAGTSPMHRVVARSHYPHSDELVCAYLDALDWVLDDGVIDKVERAEIERLAREWGIAERDRIKAHRDYFDCIVVAAKRDGVISPAEHEIIARIADQLELVDVDIPEPTPVAGVEALAAGATVCFTGMVFAEGKAWKRNDLEELAQQAGLEPVSGVTKNGCDILVAADVASASSKAKAARVYGKPIVSAADFLHWTRHG